ncbi:hypothetical protein GBA52_013987 [Prunus armeniaca]|nr:hypothetical protein GBA52_013987 [Prunus armeniaca]
MDPSVLFVIHFWEVVVAIMAIIEECSMHWLPLTNLIQPDGKHLSVPRKYKLGILSNWTEQARVLLLKLAILSTKLKYVRFQFEGIIHEVDEK